MPAKTVAALSALLGADAFSTIPSCPTTAIEEDPAMAGILQAALHNGTPPCCCRAARPRRCSADWMCHSLAPLP